MPETDGKSILDRIAQDRYGSKDRHPVDTAYQVESELQRDFLRKTHAFVIEGIRRGKAPSIENGRQLVRDSVQDLTQAYETMVAALDDEANEVTVHAALSRFARSSAYTRDPCAVLLVETRLASEAAS